MNKQLYIFLNLIFASLLIFPLYGMEISSKEAAQEIIQNLLFEKAQLKTKLYSPNIDQEEKTTISQQIAEINKQIHEQKVITGEKWSNKKNILWKGIKTVACLITGIVVVTLIKNNCDLRKLLIYEKALAAPKQNDLTSLQKRYDAQESINKQYKQQLDNCHNTMKENNKTILSLHKNLEDYQLKLFELENSSKRTITHQEKLLEMKDEEIKILQSHNNILKALNTQK